MSSIPEVAKAEILELGAASMFVYLPLIRQDSFRLLVLLPGTGDNEIQCQIDEYTFEQPILASNNTPSVPTYTALSYTWGTSNKEACIRINWKHFFVTDNLFSALKALRRTSTQVILWVDAICINQADVKEKQRQVLQMRRIYEHAATVIIWLGLGSDSSDEAMELMSQAAARFFGGPDAAQGYLTVRRRFLEAGLGLFSQPNTDQQISHTITVLRDLFTPPRVDHPRINYTKRRISSLWQQIDVMGRLQVYRWSAYTVWTIVTEY